MAAETQFGSGLRGKFWDSGLGKSGEGGSLLLLKSMVCFSNWGRERKKRVLKVGEMLVSYFILGQI